MPAQSFTTQTTGQHTGQQRLPVAHMGPLSSPVSYQPSPLSRGTPLTVDTSMAPLGELGSSSIDHVLAPNVATIMSAGAEQRQGSTEPVGDSGEDDEDDYAALKLVGQLGAPITRARRWAVSILRSLVRWVILLKSSGLRYAVRLTGY